MIFSDHETCLEEEITKETKYSAIFFSIAALLDGATTMYLAKRYGIECEVFAPMRAAMYTFGIDGGVILSKSVLAAGAFLCIKLRDARVNDFLYLAGVPIISQGIAKLYLILSAAKQ